MHAARSSDPQPTRTVGIGELKTQAEELIREVAESGRLTIDLELRGADATYVAVAIRRGVALITWDREQRERSAPLIAVSSPADDLDDN